MQRRPDGGEESVVQSIEIFWCKCSTPGVRFGAIIWRQEGWLEDRRGNLKICDALLELLEWNQCWRNRMIHDHQKWAMIKNLCNHFDSGRAQVREQQSVQNAA